MLQFYFLDVSCLCFLFVLIKRVLKSLQSALPVQMWNLWIWKANHERLENFEVFDISPGVLNPNPVNTKGWLYWGIQRVATVYQGRICFILHWSFVLRTWGLTETIVVGRQSLLAIYCCITIFPQTWQLKTILLLHNLCGLEIRTQLSEVFCLGLPKNVMRILSGKIDSGVLTGEGWGTTCSL